jgi:prepilin-type N-terminal cleavage/methylation domain-containing protein
MSDERGFSLTELLVAMLLMTVVLGAVLLTFEGYIEQHRVTNLRTDTQNTARETTDRLAKELRNAVSVGNPSATSVEVAEPDELVFQTVGTSGPSGTNLRGLIRVRYCLRAADQSIYRYTQTFATAVAPAVPSSTCGTQGAWTTMRVAASSVTNRDTGNRPLFLYRYSPPTSTSLTDLIAVMPSVFVDVTPGAAAPPEVALRTGIVLRNANQPPSAGFTYALEGARVILNGSRSEDPEGQALKWDWYLGTPSTGTKLGEGMRLDTGVIPSGSNQVTLRVTDVGGSTGDYTLTVVVS